MTPIPIFENIPDFWVYCRDLSLAFVFDHLISNAITLVWILLIPFLLYKNAQGRELLIGLFDDAEAFTGVRASTLLFMFHVLAVAIFIIPTPFFHDPGGQGFAKLRPVTGLHAYIAIFACTLPMLFYALVVFIFQMKRQGKWWIAAAAPVLIALAWYLTFLMLHGPRLSVLAISCLVALNMILCFSLILLIRWIKNRGQSEDKKEVNVLWNYLAVGFCMAIQLPLIAGTLRQLDWLYIFQPEVYNLHYLITVGLTLGCVLFLSWAQNLQYLSPTFVLMGITVFYLMLGDLVVAAYTLWPNWAKYLLSGGLLFVLYVLLFRKSRMHDIQLVPAQVNAQQRVALETFFNAWWATNIEPKLAEHPGADIPIYLFGIQGGGSRAGFWASQLLNRLDNETDGRFRQHLFAATSASGGSSGFGATLALWRYLDEHPDIPEPRKRLIRQYFARGVFGRNYLSGAFFQLFLAEIGKRFLELFGKKSVLDRNFTHQMDEALAFGQAIRDGWEAQAGNGHKGFFRMVFERFRSLFERGYSELDAGPGGKIHNYPNRPYLSYWYDKDGKVDARLPLYFPISFNIQTGKSGFACPVQWRPEIFVDAIDILPATEGDQSGATRKASVPLVGATHLSQLFPLMNAYTYIPGVGNFIDGGMFENQGLTILGPLHEWLTQHIANGGFSKYPDAAQRIKIRMVFVVNGAIDPKVSQPQERISQLTAIARAVGFAGIGGRTTWWQKHLRERLSRDQQPAEIILQYPDDPADDTKKVPLGRWLSNLSMATMEKRIDAADVKAQWQPLVDSVF